MTGMVALTTFDAPWAWATRGHRAAWPWEELLRVAEMPELWPGDAPPSQAEARLAGWSGALFRDDARVVDDDVALADAQNRGRTEGVGAILVDYLDEPGANEVTLGRWFSGTRFLAYTSAWHQRPWKDRPPGPRWRVLLPLSRVCSTIEAIEVARWLRHPRHGLGAISEETEHVWRCVASPAMIPGGYRHIVGEGRPIAVEAAVQQLAGWRDADRHAAALEVLGEGAMSVALTQFAHRLAERPPPKIASVWPGVAANLPPGSLAPGPLPDGGGTFGVDPGGPRPGRLTLLVSPQGSGRGALALQIAHNHAAAGFPALVVTLRMSPDEGIARLVALRASGAANAGAIMSRACDPADLSAALGAITPALGLLSGWAPTATDRTPDALLKRARAASDLGRGRPPLVLLDGVDAWERDEESLASALFDVARPAGLGADWPGADVWVVDRASTSPVWRDVHSFQTAFDRNPLDIPVPDGPVAREAHRVLGLVVDPHARDGVRAGRLGVLVDRLGPSITVPLRFDGAHGRFLP